MAVTDAEPMSKPVELANEPEFELGGLRIRPAQLAIEKSGVKQELQPLFMKVLVALARSSPDVLSRDKLIELCWDGRIVGDDALNRCILALRHLAQAFDPPPFEIQTVPRVGHRLIERDVRTKGAAWFSGGRAWLIAIGAGLLLLAAAAGLLWPRSGVHNQPASIAVLPFRNLGPGDSYFAQGIGEEILGQLGREPQFRIIGSNSARQVGQGVEASEIGRRLNVDYVLEGSVRQQGERVRVNAGLVRARDGTRLWSDSYDGRLDDIFAIQQRIGIAIATALERTLVRPPALTGPLVTTGEAYNLYLTARALIRTRSRRAAPTAVDLLHDAIRIDADYAPAWASLADATVLRGALGDRESMIAAVRESRGYAGRALSLAPELAEANRSMGQLLGYGDPRGVTFLRRAAALDPSNAENMLGAGSAYGAVGEFDRELSFYRTANALDPYWYRTTGQTAIAIAARGNRPEAEALGRRTMPDQDANLHILLGRIAWIFADYSEAARHWSIVARSGSPRWADTGQRTLRDAMRAVGLRAGEIVDVPLSISDRNDWRAWLTAPPSPAEWRWTNRDPIAADVYRNLNLMAAKLMLNASRTGELVATYDTAVGLFGLGPGRPVRIDQIHEIPIVALALRAKGRGAEADRLLAEGETMARAVHRRGVTPFLFDADVAALLAVQGRRVEALTMLELAFRRGWRQNGSADLVDLSDEPAFRSLAGEPRFARLRALLVTHYERERREMSQLRL